MTALETYVADKERNENVKKVLANKPIKKVIYVKEKLINFVI